MKRSHLSRVMTADEFIAFITPTIQTEAIYTEENNEDRTLADYLSDLSTVTQRLAEGDIDFEEVDGQ